MCSPQAAAGAQGGLNVISTIVGFIGAQQQAAAAKKAANLNYAARTDALGLQNDQLSAQSSEDHVSNAIREAQTYGRIASVGASLGLGASTLSPTMGAATGAIARGQTIQDININSKRNNIQAAGTGAMRQRDDEIASHPSPGYLALALNLGKAATGGAASYGEAGGKFGIGSGAGNSGGGSAEEDEFGA